MAKVVILLILFNRIESSKSGTKIRMSYSDGPPPPPPKDDKCEYSSFLRRNAAAVCLKQKLGDNSVFEGPDYREIVLAKEDYIKHCCNAFYIKCVWVKTVSNTYDCETASQLTFL